MSGDNLTMEEKCFVCGLKQQVGEPFTTLNFGDGHIAFCSDTCENIYSKFAKLFNGMIKKTSGNIKCIREVLNGFNGFDGYTGKQYTEALTQISNLLKEVGA